MILVTGATGNVGAEVVRLLGESGYGVKAAVRNINGGTQLLNNVEYVTFDFKNSATFDHAFQGVSKLFLVRPPAIAQVKRYINPTIDAAISAGVKHIVFLSLLGAEHNFVVPHAQIEAYIQSTGVAYTFLRASFFMQNLSTTHQKDIQEHSEIFIPAGKGKTSFIDVRDIAAVAVKALVEPGYENQAYSLTGNQALDYYEVAEMFTQILGKPIVYRNPSLLKFCITMYRRGLDIPFVAVMAGIYTTARLGLAAKVTQDIENTLHRQPIEMQQFINDYRQCWL